FYVLAGAAQDRFHAYHELSHAERLGNVVVGAELKANDSVRLFGAGGKHDDGNIAGRPEPSTDIKSAGRRQHDIEDDQVGIIGSDNRHALLGVGGRNRIVTVLA